MATVIVLFIGDECYPRGFAGNFFRQARLLIERMVDSGKLSHGYCYTMGDDLRIIDWYEKENPCPND